MSPAAAREPDSPSKDMVLQQEEGKYDDDEPLFKEGDQMDSDSEEEARKRLKKGIRRPESPTDKKYQSLD